MNYLIGGATYVLANLWDVTDKDIDKLSMECMRMFFTGINEAHLQEHSNKHSDDSTGPDSLQKDHRGKDGISNKDHCRAALKNVLCSSPVPLAQALSSSRDVCKLKHAVGCAPVVYGMPEKLNR